MKDAILVLNAGSSSIKFAVYGVDAGGAMDMIFRGMVEGIGEHPHFFVQDAAGKRVADQLIAVRASDGNDHATMLNILLGWIGNHGEGIEVRAAGHRVVHGGEVFSVPAVLDEGVMAQLEKFVPLAPLHQPHNLAAVRAFGKVRPDLPQVACFDTAFHRTQPPVAQAFALPRSLSDEGVKRYGFHGLSYEYIASVLPEYLGEQANGRVVVAHLGNGSSMCGIKNGKSVASTMGFTALDGLPMGTRCGAIDPGVLLYLMDEKHMDSAAITKLLYKQSGLVGVSGISSDMRELLGSDNAHAREAVELYVYRICREIGSLAATLGGLDALVFTAGIGEHAAAVREMVCRGSEWLGIDLDVDANAKSQRRISKADSRCSAWAIPTNEEIVIARHTWRLLQER